MNRGGSLIIGVLVSSLFAGLLAAVGAGCGSSADSNDANGSSGSNGGPANPGGAEACAKYVAARNDAEKKCHVLNVSLAREAEYAARLQRQCETIVGAPGSGVTAAIIDQCTADVSATCGTAKPCEAILDGVRGTLADGAACVYGSQCASGECKKDLAAEGNPQCGKCVPVKQIGEPCQKDPCVHGAVCLPPTPSKTPTEPVCIAIRQIAEGEPCATGAGPESCAKGLECRPAVNDLPRICVRPAGAGETCGSSNGLFCAPGLTCVDDHCTARVGAGEACAEPGNWSNCGSGLTCDSTSKTCVSIVFEPTGAVCDTTLRLCERGTCFATGGSEKKCVDYAADGQACKSTSGDGVPTGPFCDVTAACRNERCQLDDPSSCK